MPAGLSFLFRFGYFNFRVCAPRLVKLKPRGCLLCTCQRKRCLVFIVVCLRGSTFLELYQALVAWFNWRGFCIVMLDLGSCTMQLEVGPMTHKKFVVHGSCVMVQVLHSLFEQCLWLVYPLCDAFCLAKSPMNNFSNSGLSFWGPLFLRLSNLLGATFIIRSLPLALSFLSTSTTTMH